MLHTVKKIVAILLVSLLTLSFAACGAEDTPTETGSAQLQTSQETTLITEADPAETTAEVTAPAETDPVTTQPAQTEHAVTEPVVTEPVVTEPVVTEPVVTEPEVTEPPVTESAADPNNYFLNETNNAIDLNAVSIKPRYVYWENGQLVAECFVINGFPHTVGNINVKLLEIYNASGLIASGSFGELQGLVLPSGYHGVWKFVFSADCVAAPNAALQTLTLQYNVSNTY